SASPPFIVNYNVGGKSSGRSRLMYFLPELPRPSTEQDPGPRNFPLDPITRRGRPVERSAFSRAWEYLSFSPVPKWGAMACAALGAAFYVMLVLVAGLFTDLIVSGGRVADYRDLSSAQRGQFQQEWNV